ncbi:MAG: flavodoxin [Bacillota bacterium]
MKIGIIVYSQTGNTFSVAQKISQRLERAGHSAEVQRVRVRGDETPSRAGNIVLSSAPKVDGYDALILGAPVQAFSLVPVMTTYLGQLPSLEGTPVACFVTKQLPFNWTGGNRAVGRMKRLCESKGADVRATEIVIWYQSRRAESIRRCVDRLGSLFAI